MSAADLPKPKIWSGLLRLAHWSLVVLVAGTLLTALEMRLEPAVSVRFGTLHVVLGKLLFLVVALRVALLFFGRGSDRIEALLPSRLHLRALLFAPLMWLAQLVFRRDPRRLEAMLPGGTAPRGVREIFRYFYTVRGETPPAGAHSPLWAPYYLLMIALLLVVSWSGLAWLNGEMLEPTTVAAVHAWSAWVLSALAGAHIVSVLFHDWRYADCGISAMISGYKPVPAEPQAPPMPEPEPPVLHLPEADPGTPTIRTRFQNELM